MLFNSFEFIVFFITFYFLYWFVFQKNIKWQNFLLLIGGYIFYGSWDIRYLLLLMASTINDYSMALLIEKYREKRYKKLFVALSITANLGMLVYFKYVNFFIDSFNDLMHWFGMSPSLPILNVILPVGISFYTFQSIAYVVSVYRGTVKATNDFVGFAAFICFFPQLVAGPIERPGHLLNQFFIKREFSYDKSVLAAKQIIWGFFKKIVIADTCAENVNYIFNNHDHLKGSLLALGAVYFAFQVYCDFSGYSDIALGTARLLGFDLTVNFKTPFFSPSVTEFWRRWHITLTTWFNDYLFIPIVTAARDWGKAAVIVGLFVIFFTSGLWHGAGWTFILYGVINGIGVIYEFLTKKSRKKIFQLFPDWLHNALGILFTFSFACFTYIFFRSNNLHSAIAYIKGIFSKSLFSSPGDPNLTTTALLLIAVLIVIDFINRKEYFQFVWKGYPKWIQIVFIYGALAGMIYFSKGQSSFIYFQF